MSIRRTLALLDAIVLAEEHHPGSTVLTLPVVHDALGPEEDLVSAFAHHRDGRYIDIAKRAGGAEGPINRPLAKLVTEAFKLGRLEVEFEESSGRITGTLSAHPEPEGGLAILLRLAEVLVSAELDARLVIVSYPLAGMDNAVAGLAWELCGLSVSASPPPLMCTFVPIAVGEVSVSRHCRAQNAVRFAVRDDRLIKRGVSTDLQAGLRAVLMKKDQPVVLFLGAGASASAGVSVGDTLRDVALRDLVGAEPTSEQLVETFRQSLETRDRLRPTEKDLIPSQFRDRLTLERVLFETFHRLAGRDPALSPPIARIVAEAKDALDRWPDGRKAIRLLVEQLPRLVVATVNFDQLVEHDLSYSNAVLSTPTDFEAQRELVVARLRGESQDCVPILKLHGTVENLDSLIATIDKTEFGLPTEISSTLNAMLNANDRPLTWVWIGCSMRDADLRIWLGQHDGVKDLNEWWVDPLPAQTLFDYAQGLRANQWASVDHRLEDRLITETSDIFLSHLSDYAETLS